MLAQSLRLRLLAAATLAIVLALSISGAVLAHLFARHVEARAASELINHQNQIIAGLSMNVSGELNLTTVPADPRFDVPNGGLYWQIDLHGGSKRRSRSLWETELVLPPDNVRDGILHPHTIKGPNSTTLLAIERALTVGPELKPLHIRVTVAVDRHEIESASAKFRDVLVKSLGVLALALIAASLLQVHVGLRPFRHLRMALQAVHSGTTNHVDGQFPQEVHPLINDMNALLARERLTNQRARERAADLAHGFKTPLAILATISRELQRDSRTQTATDINTQINVMGRHVKRELARARTVGATAISQTTIPVRPVLEKVSGALQRISADRGLTWKFEAEADAVFLGDENDLLEMTGNLAENAAKWATSEVRLSAASSNNVLVIIVEDDGPGVPPEARSQIIERGKRLDETTDGSGLGLSIVAKIVETYGGKLQLGPSPLGGLRARIEFS